mmetsp:Transcript_59858/g.142606  ORF Transcript_59858/g.142606 Transcript_59858/m.142606 type:complete len:156 (-) Transcript_59858:164-631(-)
MSGTVFVYYWLPGDNDEVDHPNAFSIERSGAGVKLREIKAHFPLPGCYHFRFKMRLDSASLWMDVTNEDSFVPVFEEKIFAKVLRINWQDGQGAKTAAPQKAAAPAPAPQAQLAAQAPPTQDMLGFGDGPTRPAAPVRSHTAPAGKADDFDMLFN